MTAPPAPVDLAGLVAELDRRLAGPRGARPTVVALDGRSGGGRSTVAERLTTALDATLVAGDDFYAGGSRVDWEAMTPAQRADHCIDWRRLRPVLGELAAGRSATWHAVDWDTFDAEGGPSLLDRPSVADPARLVVVDGVYSARPELADLVDVAVLVEVAEPVRTERLRRREGDGWDPVWDALWSSAETHYFGHVVAPARFDLLVTT